ncbi:CBS domain-containing protein [Yinghuangia sp. ASG 101]|uniref:CBS domain-containing protein n=1 Tax=Yinghuangia sp. ASG 101 TaxID=2896848 RepID=UPI001E4C2669|nr:CBS domain-containing protein [Yinghuangia sp. ASG 101]UGQ11773.1 CBS domain-containing protein [Yinghuangia sp. ASG 101]
MADPRPPSGPGTAPPRDIPGRTVADAMIRAPKVCGPRSTVADARAVLHNDHVHAVLITDGADLVAVVERPDLDAGPADLPARLIGRLHGRVIGPDADLEAAWRSMTDTRRRRLAVVDDRGRLLGLLCLKRSGLGFCSDTDIRARADERRACAPRPA